MSNMPQHHQTLTDKLTQQSLLAEQQPLLCGEVADSGVGCRPG